MQTCGPIIDFIADVLNAQDDEDMMDRIWRALNYEYARLAHKVSWESLRAPSPKSLDFSVADATGLWMPSDCLGIDCVWDDTNDIEFNRINVAAAQPDEWGYRYYTYYPSRSHLFEGTDLVLEKGGSSFTSASLTANGTDPDGEFVQFDDEPGLYEISSSTTPFTFTPTYNGERKTNKNFVIRPWQVTQKLVLVDKDEDELLDRTVNVYYWKMPPPLYRKQDIILLPSAEILKLRVLRSIPQSRGGFPVSKSMLDEAYDEAMGLNKKFSRVYSPRDKHFQRFAGDNCPFTKRGTTGSWTLDTLT